jgi:hypothetical protein
MEQRAAVPGRHAADDPRAVAAVGGKLRLTDVKGRPAAPEESCRPGYAVVTRL